jgi:LSD1 subclass zinc finger protein
MDDPQTVANNGEVNAGPALDVSQQAPKAPVMIPVFCVYCSTRLMYPAGAARIQCPQCNQQMDPSQPQQSTCTNCRTLLAHPPDCKWIQCPNCLTTMDARVTHEGRALTQPYCPIPNNNDLGDGTSSGLNGAQVGGSDLVSKSPLEMSLLSHEAAKPREPPIVTKKRKDPNAPKSVSNAYMIFCKATRPKLRDQHSDLKFGQIGAKLGAMWRSMSASEKKPYDILANKDRERYRHEMILYTAAINQSSQRHRDNGMEFNVHEAANDLTNSVVDGEGVEETDSACDTPMGAPNDDVNDPRDKDEVMDSEPSRGSVALPPT